MSTAANYTFENHPVVDTRLTHAVTRNPSTTLIMVKGETDEPLRQNIMQRVENQTGVISASFIRHNPAMLLVKYFSGHVEAERLLHNISLAGVATRRVC